jgi:hypothetical protein
LSHPYSSIGTSMNLYGFSLLLVLNACLIILHIYWKFCTFLYTSFLYL